MDVSPAQPANHLDKNHRRRHQWRPGHKGALAGKVCGAGGGGCVVLLIEPDARARVEKAVADCGGELLPMKIDRQGVTVVSQ